MDTAELLFINSRLKAANNRAYYSIYYAITAVLCLELIAFKKHKDTLAYFNKNYVHSGKFPGEIGRKVAKAAKIRHVSDYDEFYIASQEEAARQMDTAKELFQKAPICKCLADPAACNPKCSMGYDFWFKGEHYQKCRNSAFLFLVCPQNNSFIQSLILNEVEEWEKSNLN